MKKLVQLTDTAIANSFHTFIIDKIYSTEEYDLKHADEEYRWKGWSE